MGILLGDGFRLLIVQARQGGALGAFVQADAAQAVDDAALGAQQLDVAGAAHQLADQQ